MAETDETTVPIVRMAKENDDFRKVVMTGDKMQVVLMSIPAGKDIGGETHEGHDQVLVFVAGSGKARIGDTETSVGEGSLNFVPSGAYHNFVNDGDGPLKLYTLYSPPEHDEGTHHRSKEEAEKADA